MPPSYAEYMSERIVDLALPAIATKLLFIGKMPATRGIDVGDHSLGQ